MGILEAIKNDGNIRRIFGKRELLIIEKQLLGVALRPSERTRLSRDIRKKFEAIRALAPFEKSFSLKHGAIIKEITEEAKGAILKSRFFPRIRKIILFGSAVDKNLTLFSDIDIAVEFDAINKKEATLFRLEALKIIDEQVDIQVYNALPKKIRGEIDKKGKLLYERKG